MKEEDFRSWLSNMRHNVCGGGPLDPGTVASRIANCKRVELFEGDLDEHFGRDRFRRLIERLSYSRHEQRMGVRQHHRVPIDGDIFNGTATLKSAIRLYEEFREHQVDPESIRPSPVNGAGASSGARVATSLEPLREYGRSGVRTDPQVVSRGPRLLKSAGWPVWPQPDPQELLVLAHLVVPFVRFLNPDIVRAVVEDNERHRAVWIQALEAKRIDASAYLWEGSPCAFPGVRRYAGSREIAAYRGHTDLDESHNLNALDLDDNDYPKHLWSFVFLGKQFSKFGPDGYSLAHLADHKDHGNRGGQEFEVISETGVGRLYGLYTCPSNSAYLPSTMIKPTDFAGPLRSLLIRRSQQLYGSFCSILPPHLRIPDTHSADWSLDSFKWAHPVGATEYVPSFLKFRSERLRGLIEKGSARQNGKNIR